MSGREVNKPSDGANVWQFLARIAQSVKGSSFFAPILAALLGVLGFWLSPLKQKVYDYLYPPKPLVKPDIVCVHKPMMRGDSFIVSLHLVPNGNSLPAGQISTTVPSELSLESCSKCGPALVDLDGTEKAKVVTYVFDALKAGKPHLMYIYNFSRGGSIQQPIDLEIVEKTIGFPTSIDLSGEWVLIWDKGLGELNITQQATSITGSFSLTEADSKHQVDGNITGFVVNGYNVSLILVPNESRSKAMYANLLKVSGPNELTICGHLNQEKNEPFVGQVVDPNASIQEICKGSNLVARAQLH